MIQTSAHAAGLLVAGTTSDAGKSVVTTALARAFARRGLRVTPYKAQNMSNNSMVCRAPDGSLAEIGRAQWIQALAARAEPEPAMNPVLLKPGSDRRSHVVVMGRPAGALDAADFAGGRRHLQQTAHAAFDDLRSRSDLVLCEGAGSPTEINLRAGDYVNMGLARHAEIPVIVVGDIDRGGVFAAFHGTTALLDAGDQRLIAGYVVNKFRGDLGLLQPGLTMISELTGRPVLGVLPWHPDLWLDSEDALDADVRRGEPTATLRIAVVRFPRISNFTDLDALALEPAVDVRFVSDARGLAGADLVVLPGTRATVADLGWLRSRDLDLALIDHVAGGGAVLGICGGYQMLGRTIDDPDHVESRSPTTPGLGLLDASTTFTPRKTLDLPYGFALGQPVRGYEIHHGRTTVHAGDTFAGGVRSGPVWGTLWHGSLECDGFREVFLTEVAAVTGATYRPGGVVFAEQRQRRLDLLGDLAEQHLDLDRILALARTGPPPLPVLPPGAGR